MRIYLFLILASSLCIPGCSPRTRSVNSLRLNEHGYFETNGLNVLVFSNRYSGLFSDSKISGIEIIHHEVRTATNGDVRLNRTPEQWDPIPEFTERKVMREENCIEAILSYPEYEFRYMIRAEARDQGILLSVHLDEALPAELENRAGFNLEFLPSAYFGKTYLMDGKSGLFPLYPGGPMEVLEPGTAESVPLARGSSLVLAPEDPARRITITSPGAELSLYDGRNRAQNGWYVVRSMIPADSSGRVVEWFISASTIPGWIRPPVIAHSQVGYHPDQSKVAVIEHDKNDEGRPAARLLMVLEDGRMIERFRAKTRDWGRYLRYDYSSFDFSSVTDQGIYVIEYGRTRTLPFRIAPDVYGNAWQPTLDVFLPVQMDHMLVNEAYRVWHGAAHLDDALQAPPGHQHFDLYAQGPETDTRYRPGEHIPGLNTGGWFDAGDYDIRTQSQYSVVSMLSETWERFRPEWDETSIDQENRFVNIRVPDGKPDILQQIEHGTLALLAQHRAVGHAINGIISQSLSQYTHLGDAAAMTDNLVFDPRLDPLESSGDRSGTLDDRWAFTSRSTPLNYGSAAALAAASRSLRGYNDELAEECLVTAVRVWEEEHSHEPDLFRYGNTTGGSLDAEELKAAVELLISTEDPVYAERIKELLPGLEERFGFHASLLLRAMPHMDEAYAAKMKELAAAYAGLLDEINDQNPFGVPISRGGWAGSGGIIRFAATNYALHKAFPEMINPEFVYRGLNFVYGCHPGSDISFVSGIGASSKKVAYGTNRADYSFIAGGIVPGVLILEPDFPENKEDWPFLWGENEYVITVAAAYIFAVHAAIDLLNDTE